MWDALSHRVKGSVEIPVRGIDCAACASTLEHAIRSLPGVRAVEVDAAGARAIVHGAVDPERVAARIEELGFSIPGRDTRGDWTTLVPSAVIAGVIVVVGVSAFQWAQHRYYAGGGIESLNVLFSSLSAGALGLAFLFGLLVGFSPSTLAMAPAVMGYVAGSRATSRRQPLLVSLGFVGGIATVDLALGALFATLGGAAIAFFSSRLPVWYAILTVVLLGLALMLLRVGRARRLLFPRLHGSPSARGAYLMGLPFGLVACPGCTPLLLPVALGAAATGNAVYGAGLMGAFALGRGIPLVLAGLWAGAVKGMRELSRFAPAVERVVGLLLLGGAAYFAWQLYLML